MTIVYRPVPIETEEQATQTPDGSMAYCDAHDAYGKPCRSVAGKPRGAWWSDDREIPVTGWTALVPIEAKEEAAERHRLCDTATGMFRRLVTPWEEA